MKTISLLAIAVFAGSFLFLNAGCKKSNPIVDPTNDGQSNFSSPQPSEPQMTTQEGQLTRNEIDEITKQLRPIFFDFDRSSIRQDQIEKLMHNSTVLKQYASVSLLLEGHCDERGTEEYNLALGERRAKAVKDYLTDLGIEESRINTISYGENKPFAYGQNENSWQQNRRGHPVAIKAAMESTIE